MPKAPFKSLPDAYCLIQKSTIPFGSLLPIEKSIQMSGAPFRRLRPHSKVYIPIHKSRAQFQSLPLHSEVWGPIQKSITLFTCLSPHSDTYHFIQVYRPIQMSIAPLEILGPGHATLVQKLYIYSASVQKQHWLKET